MAGDVRALQRAIASDPVPTSGAGFVSYVGGRQAAVQALTGMERTPRRADYGSDAQYAAARTTWRTASRRVQRWTAPEGRERRAGKPAEQLTPAQRRRAQTVNRTAKRAAVRSNGLRASLTALIVINSPGKGGRDSRRRTITNGGAGVPIDPETADAILDALAEGDQEAARELLADGFLDGASLPGYTELAGASWTIWPATD